MRRNRAPSAQGQEADIVVLGIDPHFQGYGNPFFSVQTSSVKVGVRLGGRGRREAQPRPARGREAEGPGQGALTGPTGNVRRWSGGDPLQKSVQATGIAKRPATAHFAELEIVLTLLVSRQHWIAFRNNRGCFVCVLDFSSFHEPTVRSLVSVSCLLANLGTAEWAIRDS